MTRVLFPSPSHLRSLGSPGRSPAFPIEAQQESSSLFPHHFVTYVNTSNPQPAKAVKSLGLRSRAGFMAQPLFIPREEAMVTIRRPMITGSRPLGTPKFLESKMAKMTMRRSVVATTWVRRKCTRGSTYILPTGPPQNAPSIIKNKPSKKQHTLAEHRVRAFSSRSSPRRGCSHLSPLQTGYLTEVTQSVAIRCGRRV